MGRSVEVLLLCVFAAAAQDSRRGRDPILDRVVEAYTTVQGYQIEVVTTDRVIGAPANPRHRTLFVAYGAPDRLRLEDKDKKEITAFHDQGVSTSGNGRTVYLAPGRPTQPPPPPFSNGQPLGPDQDLGMPAAIIPPGKAKIDHSQDHVNDYIHRSQALAKIGLTDYTAIESHLKSARVLRQEEVTVDGVAVPCSVVEATYPHGETRTFWVDTSRYAVAREVDLFHGDGPTKGKEVQHTITVRTMVWDQPSPQSLFDLRSAFSANNRASAAFIARHPELHGAESPHPVQPCQSHIDTPESEIAHLTGSVGISFTVATDGTPVDVRVTRPLGMGVDVPAADCVSQSQWLPAEKDGKPIEWKMSTDLSLTEDRSSDWSLGRVQFLPEEGASRPVFLKTKYPEPQGAQGRIVIPLHLTIDKEGIPRDIQVISPGIRKLDRMAIQMR